MKQIVMINTFMPASDFGLVQFVRKVSEMCRGKAYFTTPDTLGEYLLMDYMQHKSKTIHEPVLPETVVGHLNPRIDLFFPRFHRQPEPARNSHTPFHVLLRAYRIRHADGHRNLVDLIGVLTAQSG
jgi:hypothetical protein